MPIDRQRRRALLVGAGLLLSGCGGTREVVRGPGLQYIVQPGDSLASIARRSGLSISSIYRVNRLGSAELRPGQRLTLPGVTQLRDEVHDYIEVEPDVGDHFAGPLVVRRQSWGAKAMGDNYDPMPRIDKVTLHHTAMDEQDHLPDLGFIRLVQDRHQARGWADIGYHYIIGFDGRIFQGRPEKVQGAHVGGDRNKYNLGIALRGNFMRRMPTDAQMATLQRFLPDRLGHHHVGTRLLYGHRDLGTTLCPGDRFYAWLQGYKRSRV